MEQLHELEDHINQLVTGNPARFNEGLEVYHVYAALSEDEQTVSHLTTVRGLDREVVVAGNRHAAEFSAARSQIDIDALRRKAIEQMLTGEHGLLLHHLTVHREDTMGVLKLLQQQDQVSAQARTRLLEQFRDRLLPEELDGLAELLIQHTRDSIEQPTAPQPPAPHVLPDTSPPVQPLGLHNKSRARSGQSLNGRESELVIKVTACCPPSRALLLSCGSLAAQ